MMAAFEIKKLSSREQTLQDVSYFGGYPNLPPNVNWPICKICERPQTFFFQLRFPLGHLWSEKNVAVFQCTRCDDKDHQLPPRPPGLLRGERIPSAFLDLYQENFKVIVFNSTEQAIIRKDSETNLLFHPMDMKTLANVEAYKTKVGGEPYWIGNEVVPIDSGGNRFVFLMQIKEGFTFPKTLEAPYQWRYSILTKKGGFLEKPYYELFLGLPLLFFGLSTEPSRVLVLNERA